LLHGALLFSTGKLYGLHLANILALKLSDETWIQFDGEIWRNKVTIVGSGRRLLKRRGVGNQWKSIWDSGFDAKQ